jgi:Mg-chelatase subunit ChlD
VFTEYISACSYYADIAFILDQSTSIDIHEGAWQNQLDFVVQVIRSFAIGQMETRIGLIVFSDSAELKFDFNRFSTAQDIINYVTGLRLGGGETNMAAAFRIANQQLFPSRRSSVKTICVLITDGQPNIETSQTFVEINKTKELGVEVFAIGVTDQVSWIF